MAEEILLDQIDASFFDDTSMSKEDIREAAEGNLVPAGRWEGQLQPDSKVTVIATESGTHPLEGEKVVRCHVILSTDKGERHLFFDAIPKLIKLTAKSGGTFTAEGSVNAAHFYAATKLYGRPFHEVLQYAMEHRLIYAVGVKKATEDYPARNVLRGIYPIA